MVRMFNTAKLKICANNKIKSFILQQMHNSYRLYELLQSYFLFKNV